MKSLKVEEKSKESILDKRFQQAIETKDHETLKIIINEGYDINKGTEENISPALSLFFSGCLRSRAFCEFLKDKLNESALKTISKHAFIYEQDFETAQNLIDVFDIDIIKILKPVRDIFFLQDKLDSRIFKLLDNHRLFKDADLDCVYDFFFIENFN